MDRRNFVHNLSTGLAGTALGLSLVELSACNNAGNSGDAVRVRNIIDRFIESTGKGKIGDTVDTLKSGNLDQVVTGVVTTMFATIENIREAIRLRANFIIAHEPTFYNHRDETGWLSDDPVYTFKANLLKKNGIAVWRNHDYIHSHEPDGIYQGTLSRLGWKPVKESEPWFVELPSAPATQLIEHCKKTLDIPFVRYLGDPAAPCSRITLSLGAAGGKDQIEQVKQENPDLVIVGELSEWELQEYIRDRQATGTATNLLILGHIPSEQAGMKWMADWLKKTYPGLPSQYLQTKQVVRCM